MKKKIILIVAIALLVCFAAIASFACGTKEVKVSDLGGKTYKFYSVTFHTRLLGYNFLSTYVKGDIDTNKYTFEADTMTVKFDKDGSTGTVTYNYNGDNETYTFTYTTDEVNNEIKVEITSLDYSATVKFSDDMMIVDTDGFFGHDTCVTYLRLV